MHACSALLLSGALILVSTFGARPVAAAQAEPLDAATEQQLDVAQQAFDLLLDRFVEPLSPPILLEGAWHELTREAADLIRGPVGSPVELLVQRRGESRAGLLRLSREQIVLDFVVARQIGDVGYLLLRGFPEPTVIDRVERELDAFEQHGARGVVVDVRGNSGGRVDLGARLLSDFLPADTELYEVVDRTGNHQTRVAADGTHVSLPLAVLIDQRTQSMAEIFAAAVHEQAGAKILGHTSAGKVAGGRLFPLKDGSALDITTFEIRSSTGDVLNGVGVVPEETVEGDRATTPDGTDPLIDRAVDLLDAQP
jgi:carboxyl-terminal processing protease